MTARLPLNTTTALVGRSYGIGSNRSGSSRAQLHPGQDFVSSQGDAVLAPLDGVVVAVGASDGPRVPFPVASAVGGGFRMGQAIGMGGYGNFVVLSHDTPGGRPVEAPFRRAVSLPDRVWTLYAHLASPPTVRPGQAVRKGQQIGVVGATNNGQFAGMGAHLHFEVRSRPFPGSPRSAIDPNVFWHSFGYQHIGARKEGAGLWGRVVGGQLVPATALSGLGSDEVVYEGSEDVVLDDAEGRAAPLASRRVSVPVVIGVMALAVVVAAKLFPVSE